MAAIKIEKIMNWKDYELEIHKKFQDMYPNAEITHNIKLPGRYSKIDRQIDVLVEEHVVGERIRIMIDGKYFSKNIDVKEVESFIGMMKDVDVAKGLLITQKGYSQAAIKRAYNDPNRIELDILNFEELKQFQGEGAIPYSGKHGVTLPSPFGWIIDGTSKDGYLATLYQRGLSIDDAMKKREWMYINIFSKTEEIDDLNKFCKMHESNTLEHIPDAKISYQKSLKRKDANTLLRLIEIDSYPTPEYTGFVEFKEFIFFCVLFTPEELVEKNIKKLEYILSKVLPISINSNSVLHSNLNGLERRLKHEQDIIIKAEILIDQGNILKTLEKYQDSEEKYNDSLYILPTSYGAMIGKLDLLLKTKKTKKDIDKIVDNMFLLAPVNPTVCQDILKIFDEHNKSHNVITIFERKIKEYKDNEEAQGNINYHLGLLYFYLNDDKKANEHFSNAQKQFASSLDPQHDVFKQIELNLKEIEMNTKK
jgi:tetratricopeptide (TPR) repeat protein